MKFNVKGGANRPPAVKAGTHIARINAFIDLGTQPGSPKYPTPKRKVYLGFEFPSILVEFRNEDGSVDKSPARLGRFMAASMHEKATMRRVLTSILGRALTDKEAATFDPREILGKAVMLPVAHKVVGDKTYANAGDPVPLPEGIPEPGPLAAPAMFYDTDAHDSLAFDALPDFLKEMINGRIVHKDASQPQLERLPGGLPDMGTDDDIPL